MVTGVGETLAAAAAVLALTDLWSAGPHRYRAATLRQRIVSVSDVHGL